MSIIDMRSRQETVLSKLVALAQERSATLKQLRADQYAEPDVGVVGAYLAKIRRDGVGKHAGMKQRLDEVSADTAALVVLLEMHEPQAQSEAFKRESKRFRRYAAAWLDRWNSVMEVFMLGGNYPSMEVPYPTGFDEALAIEAAEAG